MPSVPQQAIDELLGRLPRDQRAQVADMIKGKVVKRVKCLSKTCKGRVIAYVYSNGQVQPTTDKGSMYLLGSRPRLDKEMGFQCICGNDSRLAKAEEGQIGTYAPGKKNLEEIWNRLESNPPDYTEKNGTKEVDGFRIEEMKGEK